MSSTPPDDLFEQPPRRPRLIHNLTMPATVSTSILAVDEIYLDHRSRSAATASVTTPTQALARRITEPTIATLASSSNELAVQQVPALQPSYWTDHAHLTMMLRLWDAMHKVSAKDVKDGRTVTQAKVDAMQRRMLRFFGELQHGKVTLSKEWIICVLTRERRIESLKPQRESHWAGLGTAAATGLSKGWGPW